MIRNVSVRSMTYLQSTVTPTLTGRRGDRRNIGLNLDCLLSEIIISQYSDTNPKWLLLHKVIHDGLLTVASQH
jgi:hypothetical protein